VARTLGSLEDRAHRSNVNRGRGSGWVDIFDARQEDKVYAGSLEHRQVSLFIARVALEILARSELGRVDEDRRDDRNAARSCRTHQRLVTGVEGTHRRHEADRARQF